MKSKKKNARATDYGLKPFRELRTSTSTVMVYTNIKFNIPKIFEKIRLTEVDVPRTKKQKNVDKKKLEVPYGHIISVQSKTKIRGVDIRKKKKHWCTICQPVKIVDDKVIKIFTIKEELEQIGDTDAYMIMYNCDRCKKLYHPSEMKKINHFLNQLTVVLSVGTQPLINIMLFKDNLKLAGCKSIDDAMEAILVLWQDFILPNPDLWKLKKGASNPRFLFETVMRNVDFKIGWPIERPALNELMNDPLYEDKVYMSQFESTNHTNVNIKMYAERPADFTYEVLIIPLNPKKSPYVTRYKENPYKSEKKKKREAKEDKYVTFIAFSSSEIILSGRYDSNMEEMYNFFVHTVFTHKDEIEEKLDELNATLLKKLQKDLSNLTW